MKKQLESGFALPTVVIVGTVLFGVMAIVLGSVSSVRSTLDAQYYESLARDAAESGAVFAQTCMKNNNYNSSWGTNSLYTGGTCSGSSTRPTGATAANFVLYKVAGPTNKIRSFYQVNPMAAGSKQLVVVGTVELLRTSDNSVWKTYAYTLRAVAMSSVGVNYVTFGYSNNRNGTCMGGHYIALDASNNMMGVGNNGCGQLGFSSGGVASPTVINTPTAIPMPSGVKVSYTASPAIFMNRLSGGVHTAFIGDDGYAYMAGRNYAGHLGFTTGGADVPTFTRYGGSSATIGGNNGPYGPIKFIALSATNIFVVTQDGHVYSSGLCANGLAGTGYTVAGCSNVTTPTLLAAPVWSASNASTRIVKVVGDNNTRHALAEDGTVYSWGENATGALGIGVVSQDISTPTKAKYAPTPCGTLTTFGGANVKALDIYDTGGTAYILADNGKLYSAGDNTNGSLGFGDVNRGNIDNCSPKATSSGYYIFSPFTSFNPALTGGETIVEAATDQNFVAIRTSSGKVYAAGDNYYGQLGCGDYVANACPSNLSSGQPASTMKTGTAQKFILPGGVTATSIIAPSTLLDGLDPPDWVGDNGSIIAMNLFVLGSDGKVYGAGSNDYGQLGNGCADPSGTSTPMTSATNCAKVNPTPVVMTGQVASQTINQLLGGDGTTVVKAANGLYYSTGYNSTGQLGSGNTTNSSVPTAYANLNIRNIQYF